MSGLNKLSLGLFFFLLVILIGEVLYLFVFSPQPKKTDQLSKTEVIQKITNQPSPLIKKETSFTGQDLVDFAIQCSHDGFCQAGSSSVKIEGRIRSVMLDDNINQRMGINLYKTDPQDEKDKTIVGLTYTKTDFKGKNGETLTKDQLKIGDLVSILIEYDYMESQYHYLVIVIN